MGVRCVVFEAARVGRRQCQPRSCQASAPRQIYPVVGWQIDGWCIVNGFMFTFQDNISKQRPLRILPKSIISLWYFFACLSTEMEGLSEKREMHSGGLNRASRRHASQPTRAQSHNEVERSSHVVQAENNGRCSDSTNSSACSEPRITRRPMVSIPRLGVWIELSDGNCVYPHFLFGHGMVIRDYQNTLLLPSGVNGGVKLTPGGTYDIVELIPQMPTNVSSKSRRKRIRTSDELQLSK